MLGREKQRVKRLNGPESTEGCHGANTKALRDFIKSFYTFPRENRFLTLQYSPAAKVDCLTKNGEKIRLRRFWEFSRKHRKESPGTGVIHSFRLRSRAGAAFFGFTVQTAPLIQCKEHGFKSDILRHRPSRAAKIKTNVASKFQFVKCAIDSFPRDARDVNLARSFMARGTKSAGCQFSFDFAVSNSIFTPRRPKTRISCLQSFYEGRFKVSFF